ncbi:exodeoxyribonuclease VII large subunit [Weissella hellenica]|uniref:Exodeoxyribonuclease 7 large subunit n=1 Tax=Weissella hellenica TaxID=46256 RepID=A0A4Y4G4I7_WEIHE|nr:exodeoxyribonuclease VII large subunit [Weissella hellenica]NKY66826.1 exodeoxyribonuclease VII large subunit [Weissella hellenica]GED35755.1 exodeoxyribonuclease 7 large subunit [Weissella hellenica]SCB89730.1 Exodeoxyribonuclease VII large subunit [Weissella hellenica]
MAEYLTVSALTAYLKHKFVADPYLKKVYVTGEISNFRQRSGHQYFKIKDEQAVLSVTMFKTAFNRLKFRLEPGMKVNIVGHIDLYAPNGSYSLIIDSLEPDGVGALYQAYEQLKNKLEQEGLFNTRQAPVSRFPKKIAVITSPSGAVIRDIMTTVNRRYPIAQLVLYPAVVQGSGAVPSLSKQIDAVNQANDYDVLIIGRGGGSIEDLWAFNDESLVRRLLTVNIPIISSVGHETDTTIADFIADKRAATPTAAAELATPVPLADLWLSIQQAQQQLVTILQREITQRENYLARLQKSYVLTNPERLYEGYLQRLDMAQDKLVRAMTLKIERPNQQLQNLVPRLNQSMNYEMTQAEQHFKHVIASLQLVSPLAILSRGYSVTRKDATVIHQLNQVAVKDEITVQLSDGEIVAQVTEKKEK